METGIQVEADKLRTGSRAGECEVIEINGLLPVPEIFYSRLKSDHVSTGMVYCLAFKKPRSKCQVASFIRLLRSLCERFSAQSRSRTSCLGFVNVRLTATEALEEGKREVYPGFEPGLLEGEQAVKIQSDNHYTNKPYSRTWPQKINNP